MPSFLGHPRAKTILVPAPVYATWNPAGTNPNITLSNWNLTAEVTGSGGVSRSTGTQNGKDIGNFYLEFAVNRIASSGSSIAIGLIDTDQVPSGDLGDLAYAYAWRLDGVRENNGAETPYGVAAANGNVLMMACKLYQYNGSDVADLYFGVNGAWFEGSDPSLGVSPAYLAVSAPLATDFLVGCTMKTVGDRITANFGQMQFSYTVPVGFNAGWSA